MLEGKEVIEGDLAQPAEEEKSTAQVAPDAIPTSLP